MGRLTSSDLEMGPLSPIHLAGTPLAGKLVRINEQYKSGESHTARGCTVVSFCVPDGPPR